MKNFKLLSTSLIVALSFASSQASYGMEEEQFHQFSNLPKVLQKYILEVDAYNRGKENKHFCSNKVVCKGWKNFYEANDSNNNIKNAWHEGRLVHLQQKYNITDPNYIKILKKVYNGKLVYTDPETKKTTELLISGLRHPLEGEFDLSDCGNTGNKLCIYMGYRKKMNSKNARKVEIWVAPRFSIEKELNANASHFQPIMDDWKQEQAPVGIFWTWGGWNRLDWYDHSTSSYMDELSKINLLENWKKSVSAQGHASVTSWITRGPTLRFHISFVN